jgi:RNA polymerase sigma factor (sigma-70 family)
MHNQTAREEFIRLIQQNKGIIIKICKSYCRSRHEHDDLAQEITYQLWRSWANYKPEYVFSTWMYRVALNVAISFYRNEKRALPIVSLEENAIDPEDQVDGAGGMEENIKVLQEYIQDLHELDKALILLYLESKPYKEIAAIMGISETNVATRLSRIKEKLKQHFSVYANK